MLSAQMRIMLLSLGVAVLMCVSSSIHEPEMVQMNVIVVVSFLVAIILAIMVIGEVMELRLKEVLRK